MSSAIGTGLTEVTTEQKAELGAMFEIRAPSGYQKWIYIKNESGGSYPVGCAVARKDSQALQGVTVKLPISTSTAGHPFRAVGVVQHVIADGSFGWVLREGPGLVLADTGGIAANTALTTGNAVAGALDSGAAVTTEALGWAHVAIAAAATGAAYVSCRG